MTDDNNTTPIEVEDDLEAFEAEFFQTKAPATKEEKVEPEDTPLEDGENEGEPEEESDNDGEDTPAPDDEDEEAPDDEEPDEDSLLKVKPKRKSAGERIKELTAQRYEVERERDEIRRERDRLRAEMEAKGRETDVKRAPATLEDLPNVPGAPTPDDKLEDGEPKYPLGEFDPLFISDLTRFTIRVETQRAREEEAKLREQEEINRQKQELEASWTEKLAKVDEELPDFREKAAVLERTFRGLDPNYGQYLASTVMSMDFGPQVLHYLGTNLDEARSIVNSGPTVATLALGRIEERLQAQAKAAKEAAEARKRDNRVTGAPTPPLALNRGSGGGKQHARPDTDDLDAFADMFFQRPGRR